VRATTVLLALLLTAAVLWSSQQAAPRRSRASIADTHAAAPIPRETGSGGEQLPAHRVTQRFRSPLALQLFVVKPWTDDVVEWLSETPSPDGVAVRGVWGVRPLAPTTLANLIEGLRGSGVRALELNHHCEVAKGDLALLAQLPELVWLSVSRGTVTADSLSAIGRLRGLRYLDLFGCGLRDELEPLRNLVHLETLDLSRNLVGDEGAHHLSALPSLERLHLRQSMLTAEGYRALVAAPRLRHLELGSDYSNAAALAGLAGHRTLESIEFSFQDDFTPESIAHLQLLPALAHLKLDYCEREWPLEQYRQLGALRGLRSLALRHTEITDSGLLELTGFRDLEVLEFVEPAITDAGMNHLLAFPRLRSLALWDAEITDDGMRVCTRLPHLTEVSLIGHSNVTDAGLAYLPSGIVHLSVHGAGIREPDFSRFERLETLWLWDSGIGDSGLASLSRLVSLRELDLARTRVTAAGLQHLAAVSRLEALDVRETPAASSIPNWLRRRIERD